MIPFDLNGTNVTFNISTIVIESTSFKWDKFLGALVPIFTIIASVGIAIYTQRCTSKNLESQLHEQEKIMFIQMNHTEITENIKALIPIIRGGKSKKIHDFLNSGNGVYIPKGLRSKIKERLMRAESEDLSGETIQKLIDLINDYVT